MPTFGIVPGFLFFFLSISGFKKIENCTVFSTPGIKSHVQDTFLIANLWYMNFPISSAADVSYRRICRRYAINKSNVTTHDSQLNKLLREQKTPYQDGNRASYTNSGNTSYSMRLYNLLYVGPLANNGSNTANRARY